jgi:hypothetical protein
VVVGYRVSRHHLELDSALLNNLWLFAYFEPDSSRQWFAEGKAAAPERFAALLLLYKALKQILRTDRALARR